MPNVGPDGSLRVPSGSSPGASPGPGARAWLGLTALLLGSSCGGGERTPAPDNGPMASDDGLEARDDGASRPSRQEERDQMVAEQLARRGIRDQRVLDAMRRVPRHRFVPAEHQAAAYGDGPLPIGLDQTISQPFVVAFMTEALALDGSERVLEIGSGSGYQTAILAELAREVWSIEILEPLTERARGVIEELGYRNVTLRTGDGYLGWPEHAPFDAILVAAAPGHVPQPLLDQLAVGGRMILPVGDADQDLVLVRRDADGLVQEEVMPVRFVPMTGIAEEHDQ